MQGSNHSDDPPKRSLCMASPPDSEGAWKIPEWYIPGTRPFSYYVGCNRDARESASTNGYISSKLRFGAHQVLVSLLVSLETNLKRVYYSSKSAQIRMRKRGSFKGHSRHFLVAKDYGGFLGSQLGRSGRKVLQQQLALGSGHLGQPKQTLQYPQCAGKGVCIHCRPAFFCLNHQP